MQTRVSQKKNYVAVEIPKEAEITTKKRIWMRFRRKQDVDVVKSNNVTLKKSDLKRLLSLAKPEKYYLMGAIGFLLVSSSVTMAVPFSIGKVLDIIYSTSDNSEDAKIQLNQLCGILILVFGVGAVCNFARVYLMSLSGYRMTQALRKKVFSSILRQEQGWFDKRSTGELVNRLSSDTQIVGQALSSNISDGLRSVAMVCAGTGMMFYTSAELALVGLGIVPPVAGVAVIYGRYVRNITKKVQDTLAESTKIAEERIANVKTVKTFGHESREIKSYDHSIMNVLQIAYKEAKARALFYGMTGLTGNMIIISVLYYGGVMVSSQSISVGQLSSFLLYAAYIGVSIGGLSSFYSELNKSIGAGSRIWEIMDRQPAIPLRGGITPLELPKGKIVFQNVAFTYPSRKDIQIFDDLNLEIEPGNMVAVVGPSGSGKSTLAALLLRLYDPSRGTIFLDDYDIQQLDPVWLKKFIGTVAQEPVLFSTSIKENILYGSEDPAKITEERLLEISREANVHEFVQNLPQGYDTLVGERGIMLSGGQKQRVAIARALIKDPKILLLDEATSALDAHSEHLVQEALERVMKGRTVLTIAHRLSTIQNADTIAVLKEGKIVEKGTYQELLNLDKGVFKELMKHQTFGVGQ
ncbi:ATP-binding cassette sub-family B member 10, mitochondrial isoform X2 [Coccinella septempunctata]|nr:ATP-binding cassette sub-family B member 10, mitochondrial isoform X2 [Coccinella septempunctata]XP_044749925.1 ATP-binding cassette sub-family B member 10, mitochondrial isoform X2 [Coccinella septempunctata]